MRPDLFSGLCLDAIEFAVGVQEVDIGSITDGTGDVRHAIVEMPGGAGGSRIDGEHGRADGDDLVAGDDGGGSDIVLEGFDAPEFLAIHGVVPDDQRVAAGNELKLVIQFGEDRGAPGAAGGTLGFPDFLAGPCVERQHLGLRLIRGAQVEL